ncbi:MAG: methyl-accepting chemotaxis protein, partial [Gammaproteobacteria bacterium]|nr:methyl-accepting chemotaxis protein [Gammaproteobacteria bacterium]
MKNKKLLTKSSGLVKLSILLAVVISVLLYFSLPSMDIVFIALLVTTIILVYHFYNENRQYRKMCSQISSAIEQVKQGETITLDKINFPENSVAEIFADDLSSMLQNYYDNTGRYHDMAGKFTEYSTKVSTTSELIHENVELEEKMTLVVYGLLEKLQDTLNIAKDTADQTVEVAAQSESEGNSGKLVMTKAITGVSTLSESVSETETIISQLGLDSKSISNVVNVIQSVAEQTNLLALNAAIEAARA